MTARINIADLDEIIRADLPWAYEIGMHADAIDAGRAVLRLPFRTSMLRPGGVVSGPTITALADACMFAGRAIGDR
jgi:acyl-coenzyme A thioesterase PaaI-like protein